MAARLINMAVLTAVELEQLCLYLPQEPCLDCLGTGFRIDNSTVSMIDAFLQLGIDVMLPVGGEPCSCLEGFRYQLSFN